MTNTQPGHKETAHPQKGTKYPSTLRLWHWANAIIISGSLITVLINATITDDHATATFLKDELQKAGSNATAGQAKSVAHALSDKVWGIHIYFGYGLAALLLFRLLMEFFQLADQKFIRRLKSSYTQFKTTKKNREVAQHELTVKLIYAAFYLLLITMVVTGLFLAFEDALAQFKSIRHSFKEIHGFCMYLILAFIAVHLAGVFLAERKESKGIVSDMINGGEQ